MAPHFKSSPQASANRSRCKRIMVLVAFRRIAKRPIKKVIDQSIEFLMLIKLNGGIRQAPLAQMVDQAVFRQNQRPQDFGQRYAFTAPFAPSSLYQA